MSLKAKIEAVIYAAEEPVTLAQLVAIFAAVPAREPASEPRLDHDAGHEITTLDEFGNLADSSSEFSEPELPRLASETEDFVAPEQLSPNQLEDEGASAPSATSPRQAREYIRGLVDELIAEYADLKSGQDRGIEIREIAGGFRMATKPEYHDAVRAFVKNLKPAMKLSPQALETLAVIAYKQPVTGPEIGEIRGVDSGAVLGSLISRKLVTTAGRKQVIGRPILYKTTKEFLLGFGLRDLSELPSMEEFEKMASELAESDALEAEVMNERAGLSPLPEDGPTDQELIATEEVAEEPVPQEQAG